MLEKLMGSRLRAKALEWLFSHPDERYFVRHLASLINEDSTNLSRELSQLEITGIIISTREGKQKYYRANRESPLFNDLYGLITKTAGPLPEKKDIDRFLRVGLPASIYVNRIVRIHDFVSVGDIPLCTFRPT